VSEADWPKRTTRGALKAEGVLAERPAKTPADVASMKFLRFIVVSPTPPIWRREGIFDGLASRFQTLLRSVSEVT
jgi:hypothetical protein